MNNLVHLIDPPTYPKGVLSLGLASVAAALPKDLDVIITDLNFAPNVNEVLNRLHLDVALFVGIKVSSQNYHIAIEITHQLRSLKLDLPIIWGGEYATLLPAEAAHHADVVVQGSFEPIADLLVSDAKSRRLQPMYDGLAKYDLSQLRTPRTELHSNAYSYYSFMGIPVETSRGCDRKCTFCMVHTMQSKYQLKPSETLRIELEQYKGQFINVVDYNIGVSKSHVLNIAKVFEESETLGWMAEMCLESLDDDEILKALAKGRCRMIYCGLESIDEATLRSINKARTNHVHDYERVIRKVQSYGIQIAAGVILGLEASSVETCKRILDQFTQWGVAYSKLTFLTYNPGTKVKESMLRKGSYETEAHEHYDGNHLTFLAENLSPTEIFDGATAYIKEFYSLSNIYSRTAASGLTGTARLELALFNICYAEVYTEWLRYDIFKSDANFERMLRKPFQRSLKIRVAERLLSSVRRLNYLFDRKKK